jgi:VanZ family protein
MWRSAGRSWNVKNRVLASWLIVVGYAIVVAVLSLLPSGSGPAKGWDADIRPSFQKFGHMAAYALFAVVVVLALPAARRFSGRNALVVFVILTAFGAAMEIGQSMSPGRTPSVFDAAINATGVAVGLVLRKAWLAFRRTGARQAGQNRSVVGDR